MKKNMSRRECLELLGISCGSALLISRGLPFEELKHFQIANAEESVSPHRFLQIFLQGGWDSALATDPIVGTKTTSNKYDTSYKEHPVVSVPGKDKLNIGAGLSPALNAFSSLPTAFINGISVEVTAHEIAANYMLTGQLSLSRSREFPSFIATLANASGGFPAHVVLGQHIPLASTQQTNPPLLTHDIDTLTAMLGGPRFGANPLKEESLAAIDKMIADLNKIQRAKLNLEEIKSLTAWEKAEQNLANIYQKRYDTQIVLTDDIKTRYKISNGSSLEAKMAGAWLMLKFNLTNFITLSFGGFDTHSAHFDDHLPLLQEFATALATLVGDLKLTPDPLNPNLMLSETTTILITSEFVRTPKLNSSDGTDHWPSASAILMGKGIKDNIVIGATDDAAKPSGWSENKSVPFSQSTQLKPDDVAASLLRHFGLQEEADKISEVHLSELFAV